MTRAPWVRQQGLGVQTAWGPGKILLPVTGAPGGGGPTTTVIPFPQARPHQSHSIFFPGGFSFQLPASTLPLNLKEGKRDFQAAKLG